MKKPHPWDVAIIVMLVLIFAVTAWVMRGYL